MVSARFVNELVEGARVDAVFVLRSKEMRATRNGEAYLSLSIGDRTGTIPAVYFRPCRSASAAPVGSVFRVSGTVSVFRGVKRVSVDSMSPCDTWERTDLVREGPRPAEELRMELSAAVRSVGNRSLRGLLKTIFSDRELVEHFMLCPASQSYHHAYLGGLAEHTLAVVSLCGTLADRYPDLDKDLLLTAAILHDIGKVDELAVGAGISCTEEGRLLGHVMLGVMRVRSALATSGVSHRLARQLEHALLSHHGELEWGSPKRPSTLEAMVLHHVDNLDAKASGFMDAVSGAARAEETWTDASNLFRRPLYAPRAAEDDRAVNPPEDEEAARLSA